MIRINLLPKASKQSTVALSNQMWVGGYVGMVLVLCGLLAFVYVSKSGDLDELQQQNRVVEQRIGEVRSKVGNLEEVKAQLERSRKLEQVVTELLQARSGPARMLMELSAILSPGKGPTLDPEKLAALRRTNPEAGYTVGWDTRRLWLRSFVETDQSCKIDGVGKNNEDVAEFLRRLELSVLFDDVSLRSTQASTSPSSGLGLIAFNLDCKVSY